MSGEKNQSASRFRHHTHPIAIVTFDERIRGQLKALDWVWGKEWK